MIKYLLIPLLICTSFAVAQTKPTTKPKPFKVIAFYSLDVEPDHQLFARAALAYFYKLAYEKKFILDSTRDWDSMTEELLSQYQVVMWLDNQPGGDKQRSAFEHYMENGGAWIGFHVSAYNDKDTHWPWFVDFLGGGVFNMNNWPPLPAKMIVDDNTHPVTKDLPKNYEAPTNEWYQWKPSPRENPNVKVLVTLDPVNYPLGRKDFLVGGDTPVVWTNTKYKMIYMNQGHIDHNFDSPLQNTMYENALMWLGTGAPASK